jgi:unsaturated chondroitin disaccharide hydrolase
MTDQTILKLKGEQAIEFAAGQLRHLAACYPGQFPTFTLGGKWAFQDRSWTRWTEGFLGGQYWLVYQITGEDWFRQQAEYCCLQIESRKTDRTVHDLGFLFWPTWKRWFDLSGNPVHNQAVLVAGRTLADRYQVTGGYLCSFQGPESLYIDIMMNVGLIFYTAILEQDERLYQIALQHCLTTQRRLVRGDGSTAHEGIFDIATGAFLRQTTRQGWRDDSTWARGLTWALYGFGTAYDFSGDLHFLDTAELVARYYIDHTPLGSIPPNDWDEPMPEFPYDTSAAAIAVCGLYKLSKLVKNRNRAEIYARYASQTLDTLLHPEFLAIETPGWEGILKHGIYHASAEVGVDESTIWGDYYLLEALSLVLS